MRMQEERFRILMFSSLEGTITPGEQKELDQLLGSDPAYREQYDQLLQIREGLHSWTVPEEGGWTESQVDHLVKRAMRRQEAVIVTLGRHWQKIAAACVIILLVSIGSIYVQSGTLDSDTLVGIDEIEADEAYTYLSTNYAYDE